MQYTSYALIPVLMTTFMGAPSLADEPLKEKIEVTKEPTLEKKTEPSKTLPSEAPSKEDTKLKENIAYLKKHPAEMEAVLSALIRREDTEYLAVLIPAYQTVPNYDASVIEWATALIAESKGDYTTAIRLYRKMNAALPNIKLLRFHLSRALFRDKQYVAAKSEFEKLRSEKVTKQDIAAINQYIEAIDSENQWTFDGSISLINDANINNAPSKGTKLVVGPNATFTGAKQERGRGVSYAFSADKKWGMRNNLFTSLHLSLDGSKYVKQHSYNELTTDIGLGMGLSKARYELEFIPFFQNRLYVRSDDEKHRLRQYSKALGVRLYGSYWFTPKWKYQSSLKLSKDKYIDTYKHLDGANNSWSNTLMYLPSATQYWYTGLDYSMKNAQYNDDAYRRVGARIGWGQVWGNGLSTRLTAGVSKKRYRGENEMFGIGVRNDKEYNFGATIWHRNVHFKGITPRFSWQYHRTDSNNPLYDYDKNNFYLDFSKTF